MNRWQQDIVDLHRTMGHPIGNTPTLSDPSLAEFRAKLIKEETGELTDALARGDLVEIIDGACDAIVVILGTMVVMGIDLDPFWDEVQRSNLAKKGGQRRGDGKFLKPDGWTPPDLLGLLRKEIARTRLVDEGARALSYQRAVDLIREQIKDEIPVIQAAIVRDPSWWWAEFNFAWGAKIRNLLRSEKLDEQALGVECLDDIYQEIVEAAVRDASGSSRFHAGLRSKLCSKRYRG